MGRTSNDDRSDSMNPNNDAYHDSLDNHSNQMNPNNSSYHSARESSSNIYDDDDLDLENQEVSYQHSSFPANRETCEIGESQTIMAFNIDAQPMKIDLDYISAKDGKAISVRVAIDTVNMAIDEVSQAIENGKLMYACLKNNSEILFEKIMPPKNKEQDLDTIILLARLKSEIHTQEASINSIEHELSKNLIKNLSVNKQNYLRLLGEHNAVLLGLKNMYEKHMSKNPHIENDFTKNGRSNVLIQALLEKEFFVSLSYFKSIQSGQKEDFMNRIIKSQMTSTKIKDIKW